MEHLLGRKVRIMGDRIGVVYAVKSHLMTGLSLFVRYPVPGGVTEAWFEEDDVHTIGQSLNPRKSVAEYGYKRAIEDEQHVADEFDKIVERLAGVEFDKIMARMKNPGAK